MTAQETGSATADRGEPLVVLSDVQKHFGQLHVLKDIDLTVTRGEVVVVIGPSGSGKSTLCRTINRLETIDEGTITLDGQPLPQEGKALAALRAEVGMVFQSFNLFAHKTILENVTLGPIKVRGREEGGGREEGARAPRPGRRRPPGREVPRPALRRPAAARGDRPRPGDGAEGDALRRADLRARPGDDQGGPRRHGRPRRAGHDDDRRHPRDGLRAHGRAPRRVHGRRRDRRGEHPGGVLHQPDARTAPRTSSARSSSTDPSSTQRAAEDTSARDRRRSNAIHQDQGARRRDGAGPVAGRLRRRRRRHRGQRTSRWPTTPPRASTTAPA